MCRYFSVERKIFPIFKTIKGVDHERKDVVELLLVARIERLVQDLDDAYGGPANVQSLRGGFSVFIAAVFFNGYAQIGQE